MTEWISCFHIYPPVITFLLSIVAKRTHLDYALIYFILRDCPFPTTILRWACCRGLWSIEFFVVFFGRGRSYTWQYQAISVTLHCSQDHTSFSEGHKGCQWWSQLIYTQGKCHTCCIISLVQNRLIFKSRLLKELFNKIERRDESRFGDVHGDYRCFMHFSKDDVHKTIFLQLYNLIAFCFPFLREKRSNCYNLS